MITWFNAHLRTINKLLLLGIVLLNAYVLIFPFLPQVTFQVGQVFSEPVRFDTPEQRIAVSRDTDHVVIPKISLDQKIWIGNNESLVHKGIWHIPHSSTPDKGGNTVLVGHRFSYKDPAVFYHLDKLEVGDQVLAAWGGKLYTYKVSEKKIVNPTDMQIEASTPNSQLTLYTCHPLWSTNNRLAIIAQLESVE